jgi:hypothetical protein
MVSAQIAIGSVRVGVTALLLVAAAEASAQVYHPASFERVEQAPSFALGHSAFMNALEQESDSFDGFSKRRASGAVQDTQPERWMLYGRFGLVKFRNDFNPQGGGAQMTWRNTGPGLGGKKLFIGFQRRF